MKQWFIDKFVNVCLYIDEKLFGFIDWVDRFSLKMIDFFRTRRYNNKWYFWLVFSWLTSVGFYLFYDIFLTYAYNADLAEAVKSKQLAPVRVRTILYEVRWDLKKYNMWKCHVGYTKCHQLDVVNAYIWNNTSLTVQFQTFEDYLAFLQEILPKTGCVNTNPRWGARNPDYMYEFYNEVAKVVDFIQRYDAVWYDENHASVKPFLSRRYNPINVLAACVYLPLSFFAIAALAN